MNIKERIKSLLKEAELYKSQRLLGEAREKYTLVISILQQQTGIQNRDSLIAAVEKKRESLDAAIAKWDKSQVNPEVSGKVQDLIKRLFTPPEEGHTDEETKINEAITLAKFGQHRKALEEFSRLAHRPSVCISAAKNAVKCYLELSEPDEAVETIRVWWREGCFTPEQYTSITHFMQSAFEKKGIDWDEAMMEAESAPMAEEESFTAPVDDDIIDITSIGVNFDSGPMQGQHVELDVSFQSGSLLSLSVSSREKDLLQLFEKGQSIHDVDFYSPIAIFKGSAVVESNTEILSGPKKGDFSLDIRIDSI
jgi:tetratricopeptide (TPR) repeat protein